jgi:fluoride exporter
MNTWMQIGLVGAGGAIGSILRLALQLWAAARFGTAFPYGTLLVNVAGSFVLGVVAGLVVERSALPPVWLLFLGVGICGGFTTFSTFSYETLRLLMERSWQYAIVNVTAQIALSLLAAGIGFWLARSARW